MSKVIDQLNIILAESYVLLLKTQNYHWNVKGANFYSLHTFFEAMYRDLFEAVDVLAERLRALGAEVDGTLEGFLHLSKLKEGRASLSALEMVEDLGCDQVHITASLKKGVKMAEEVCDVSTADLLTQRITQHDKNQWMLQSLGA